MTVDGDPIRVSMCHCLACQRRTGSAFGAQARFPRDRTRIRGRSQDYVRVADDDENDTRTFSFCPECGGTVHYTLAGEPDVVIIPVGAFADPEFPPPTRSVWEARRHAWVTVPAGADTQG